MHVDLCSFYMPVLWTEKTCVVRSYLPRRCARWPSAALPSVVTCSKYVLIYVFPVELSKLADGPVEATSEKLKVKSYFREKFRCSRIMVDGKRKV